MNLFLIIMKIPPKQDLNKLTHAHMKPADIKKTHIFFYQIFLFLLEIFTKTPNCIMCSF